MKQSIRKKVLLAILLVTILTSCCITVVFYFRSASMIEKNYTETVYSRVRQTMESFDNSMKELYYKNIEIGKATMQMNWRVLQKFCVPAKKMRIVSVQLI